MKYLIVLFLIASSIITLAQSVEADTSRTSHLSEVVISVNRIPEQRKSVAQQVKIINTDNIRFLNAQTSADLISNSGFVAMQKSQQGGGSPMMRGFEASRVLLVIDGVRMNNAIYRAGHLQNIITMDNTILERAEILFGPSSTVYGSDALGGVIHFYTKNPQPGSNKLNLNGNSFIRYGSVNQEKTFHMDYNIGGKKFASLTSLTASDFGDLKMGKKENPAIDSAFGVRYKYAKRASDNQSDVLVSNKDKYKQVNSGYRQYDFLQKFLFAQSERVSHRLNFQFSKSTDIPRYDRLTDPNGTGLRFAEWYYGPQKRLMGSYNLSINDLGILADALSVTLSYQDIEESRHDRRFGNDNRNDRTEEITVWGFTSTFNKSFGKNALRYGLDAQFNSLTSTAEITNVNTGAKSDQSTRYPDGDNTMSSLAAFVTHTYSISDQLILNDGIRMGGNWLHSTFESEEFFPFPYDKIDQNAVAWSGSLGIIYNPGSWKVSLIGSTGYRVPNIDDLAKVFESQAGDGVDPGILVVPNPNLEPEKTVNADLGITKFFGDKFRIETVLFYTKIYDAIVTGPSTFNGQATVIYDGFPATVVSSQNEGKAHIYGLNASGYFDITPSLVFTGSYNYTHGEVDSEEGPDRRMDHIAPIFGRVGIQYKTKKFQSELFSSFSGWKYLSRYSASGEDNLQYATAKGMPSWYTINARTSYSISRLLMVQVGLDNILDLQYRTFASGINAPGRNVFITLRVKV